MAKLPLDRRQAISRPQRASRTRVPKVQFAPTVTANTRPPSGQGPETPWFSGLIKRKLDDETGPARFRADRLCTGAPTSCPSPPGPPLDPAFPDSIPELPYFTRRFDRTPVNLERFHEFGQRIHQLGDRVVGYMRNEPFQVLIEFAVIWVVAYLIVRFLRGTRGAWAIKGVAVILITGTLLIQVLGFERLNFLYNNVLQLATIALVIVFQPEIRRVLVRLGETRIFGKQTGLRRARLVEELVAAVEYLSKRKIGALVAIEREVGLRGICEQGTILNAEISRELLETIFWPNSKLHDLGVVLQGDRVLAAGVQFPLAEAGSVVSELGSRHRAGVGLSAETDALVIIVSEETGKVSLAERGRLTRGLSVEDLRSNLTLGLSKVLMEAPDQAADDEVDLSDDTVFTPPRHEDTKSESTKSGTQTTSETSAGTSSASAASTDSGAGSATGSSSPKPPDTTAAA